MAKWKAILVETPDLAAFTAAIRTGLPEVVEAPQQDFKSFVASWRKSPEIIVKVEDKAGLISAFTGVESNWSRGNTATPEDIFMFLTRGTSVRYATMDTTFRPKTRKGLISSGGGGGERDPLYVSRLVPRDGIEARDIEEAVAEKNKNKVKLKLQALVELAAKQSRL